MRKAMAEAEVGDDVYGDDPTVNKLEETAAKVLGKEAALFVPSGTMGNLICCILHCEAFGSEMLVGEEAHIHYYEQGGCSTLGRIHARPVKNLPDGRLDLEDLEHKIRPVNDHFPTTKLICLENTQNRCGGRVLSIEYTRQVAALAKKYNAKLHIDGARLMNAVVKLKVDPAQLVADADTVSVCLSKGLAAPVGSVIAGPKDFIIRARRVRKALGGGMRQAGVLAAAALIALTEMVSGLEKDHDNAQLFARLIAETRGVHVDPTAVETNIVYFDIDPAVIKLTPGELVEQLKKEGILTNATGPRQVRIVTHLDVHESAIRVAAEAVNRIVGKHAIATATA